MASTNAMSSVAPSSHSAFQHKMDTVSKESRLLPYYMSLSCNRREIEALLCGSFFDPEVSCNLVSPWLEPIFEVLDPLVARADYETLAIIMGKRQPKLAALWLGAIISGMHMTIFQHVRLGLLAIEPHASAWTATTHTFIGLRPRSPCVNKSVEISRSDECRLLYLAEREEHSRLPISPWKPFGTTLLRDTDIDVRRHATCARHYLRYVSWSWDLIDSTGLEDWGFITDSEYKETPPAVVDAVSPDFQNRLPKSEMLSESATHSIFSWLRVSGWPESEREIYCHSWFALEGSDGRYRNVEIARSPFISIIITVSIPVYSLNIF